MAAGVAHRERVWTEPAGRAAISRGPAAAVRDWVAGHAAALARHWRDDDRQLRHRAGLVRRVSATDLAAPACWVNAARRVGAGRWVERNEPAALSGVGIALATWWRAHPALHLL